MCSGIPARSRQDLGSAMVTAKRLSFAAVDSALATLVLANLCCYCRLHPLWVFSEKKTLECYHRSQYEPGSQGATGSPSIASAVPSSDRVWSRLLLFSATKRQPPRHRHWGCRLNRVGKVWACAFLVTGSPTVVASESPASVYHRRSVPWDCEVSIHHRASCSLAW